MMMMIKIMKNVDVVYKYHLLLYTSLSPVLLLSLLLSLSLSACRSLSIYSIFFLNIKIILKSVCVLFFIFLLSYHLRYIIFYVCVLMCVCVCVCALKRLSFIVSKFKSHHLLLTPKQIKKSE